MSNNVWRSLEYVPGLCALPITWRRLLAEAYEPFKGAFLQSRPDRRARFFPCPKGCPAWHEVFCYSPQEIVAVCRCESSACADLKLALADIVPFELNWPRLTRAICLALGFNHKLETVDLPYTRQIGSWSAGAVPVFLTIPAGRRQVRATAGELAGRLRQPFILLAPTATHLDSRAQELLANVGAGFFGLDAHVRLGNDGRLACHQAPGEILARFAPPPEPAVPEEQALAAVALIRKLESEVTLRKAPLYTVFRLYCVEGLSADQVARKCRCARSLVFSRLQRLRQKLGRDPAELRQYSVQFERIEDSLSDSRARRIYRKGAVYGDNPEDSEE